MGLLLLLEDDAAVAPPTPFPGTPRNGPYPWGAFMWGGTVPAVGLLPDMGPATSWELDTDGTTTFEFTDPPGFSTIMLAGNGITWILSRDGDALMDFWIKEGDRLPPISGALVGSNNQRLNLSTATVRFKARHRDTGAVVIDQPMSVVDALEGEVSYSWAAPDTAAAVELQGEVEVTDGGLVQTFPKPGFIAIHITEDV